MTTADILSYSLLFAIVAGLVMVTLNYAKGLRGSPRELWLLFGYKFSELAGYKLVALSAVLWLTWDCGLRDDIKAGSLYGGYSLFASAMGVIVGALIDTAGIRRMMLASIALLLFARFFMIWLTTPVLAFLFGLVPMALGFAIVSPLTSVAIKRYTTKAGAAYGFSLFYVLMNLAFTAGNSLYDYATSAFALRDATGKNIDQGYGLVISGHRFSTYQLLFAGAFCATIVSLLLTLPIREGVERDEEGIKIVPRPPTGSVMATIKKTTSDTVRMIGSVAGERFFWVFLGMIALLMFVKSVFIQWDLILPKYCPRVMGEGARVGSIYNVNTVLILFFVPLATMFTARVKSYTLMMVGAAISTAACFITAIPERLFEPLTHYDSRRDGFRQLPGSRKKRRGTRGASPVALPLVADFLPSWSSRSARRSGRPDSISSPRKSHQRARRPHTFRSPFYRPSHRNSLSARSPDFCLNTMSRWTPKITPCRTGTIT